ncbi:hypothetical protein Fcan01_01193, partial [Folsomia candida]
RLLSTPNLINLHISLVLSLLTVPYRRLSQLNIIPCNQTSWGCGLCGTLGRVFICLNPLTMSTIFYELTKPRESTKSGWIAIFLFPWLTSIFASVPKYWFYRNVPTENVAGIVIWSCARVTFLGSVWAHMGSECFSVFLKNVLPSMYMFYGE